MTHYSLLLQLATQGPHAHVHFTAPAYFPSAVFAPLASSFIHILVSFISPDLGWVFKKAPM